MSEDAPRVRVLFVCYANVCRSPMAEAIFRHQAEHAGLATRFEIDSAGTSAMEGAAPHPYGREVGQQRGIPVGGAARQLLRTDLASFDHILLMDRFNRQELRRMAGAHVLEPDSGLRARIRLLRAVENPEAEDEELDVEDPVTKEIDAFEETFDLLERCCAALLNELAPR